MWKFDSSRNEPRQFMVRSTASFVDKLKAERTRLRYDNEPATFRHPRTAILEPINRAEHFSWEPLLVLCEALTLRRR